MSSYKITAQYKKSFATIEITKHNDIWCYGFNILFKDSGLYHGHSFAPLLKWNSFKTEFECKKAAVKSVLSACEKWDERQVRIAKKLYSILYAKCSLGIDENAIAKTIKALELYKNGIPL
jgi:hypothetical protein